MHKSVEKSDKMLAYSIFSTYFCGVFYTSVHFCVLYARYKIPKNMARTIEFTKMHGLGNDYIYVDNDRFPIDDPVAFAIQWSQPHFGIASDGLILISRSEVADFRMRIFNADGSEGMMCGNGSRCVGKYVYDKGLTDKTEITLETLSGIKVISLEVAEPAEGEERGVVTAATVDMGQPLLANTHQVATPTGDLDGEVLEVDGHKYEATFVCIGNPHAVIFVDDIDAIDVSKVGPVIEHDAHFPERTNVEFVQPLADGTLRMRVWERGSGITQACGTGACATAVAACAAGLTTRTNPDGTPRAIPVRMDGGELTILWHKSDGRVYLNGPAATAFEGTLAL